MRFRIRVDTSEDLPNTVRGLDTTISAYTPRQALSGYLAAQDGLGRKLSYLFDELIFRYIFKQGVIIESADEQTRTETQRTALEAAEEKGREGQEAYLAELFGTTIYNRDGRPARVPSNQLMFDLFPGSEGELLEALIAGEREKLKKMPDNQVFAIFMKYHEIETEESNQSTPA